MAWSWGDGFDLYAATADALLGYWDSGSTSGSMQPGRFAGSQSWSFTLASGTAVLVKASGSNDAVHHICVAYKHNSTFSGTSVGAFIQIRDGATAQCSIVFRSDGAILLTSGIHSGTTLATYTGASTIQNTWYQFEFEVVINNTTGSFSVRKNGNSVNDFTLGSLNTRGGTANNYANAIGVGNASLQNDYFDDFFWRSDASAVAWMGDIRCITRMPASDASVQFSRTPTTVTVINNASSINSGGPVANLMWLMPVTAPMSGPAGAALASFAASVTGHVNMALYDNSGPVGTGIMASGSAGALLAQGTQLTNPGVGLQTFIFTTPTNVVRGTQYWVAMFADVTLASTIFGPSGATHTSLPATYAGGVFPASASGSGLLGATTGFTYVGFQMSPGNYSCVAEPQQDALTSYVYSSTPGQADFYTVAGIASTPSQVFAVTTRALAQKSDAGTRTLAAQLKSGGTTVASPTVVLTTSGWQWAWRTDTTDPATGAAWTPIGVNNAQVGPVVIA